MPSGPALTIVFARSRGTWRSCSSSRPTTRTRRPSARAWTASSWRRALPPCLSSARAPAARLGRGGLQARVLLRLLLLLAVALGRRCAWLQQLQDARPLSAGADGAAAPQQGGAQGRREVRPLSTSRRASGGCYSAAPGWRAGPAAPQQSSVASMWGVGAAGRIF